MIFFILTRLSAWSYCISYVIQFARWHCGSFRHSRFLWLVLGWPSVSVCVSYHVRLNVFWRTCACRRDVTHENFPQRFVPLGRASPVLWLRAARSMVSDVDWANWVLFLRGYQGSCTTSKFECTALTVHAVFVGFVAMTIFMELRSGVNLLASDWHNNCVQEYIHCTVYFCFVIKFWAAEGKSRVFWETITGLTVKSPLQYHGDRIFACSVRNT